MPTGAKKKRCSYEGCNKKLQLTDNIMGPCKCNGVYCFLHRLPDQHSCTFDWHTYQRAMLETELNNGKCIGKKIESF